MFCHWASRVAAAIAIGINSEVISMWRLLRASGHSNWNHNMFQNAPQPQQPQASEVSTISGLAFRSSNIIDSPFQWAMKQCHHIMSDRASLLRRMKTSHPHLWFEVFKWLIRQRRKVRLGLTTILASCRRPMSDSSSFLLRNGLPLERALCTTYELWIRGVPVYREEGIAQVWWYQAQYPGKLDMLRGLRAWDSSAEGWFRFAGVKGWCKMLMQSNRLCTMVG